MSLPNINPETNIAYGYVTANQLDADIVDSIIQAQTKDLSLESYMADNLSAEDFAAWKEGNPSDEAVEIEDEYSMFDTGEQSFEAEYQGVKLLSSWLGGALHFFIVESPHVTDSANQASPCVPNAGILAKDMDGCVNAYSVPDDWWNEYE